MQKCLSSVIGHGRLIVETPGDADGEPMVLHRVVGRGEIMVAHHSGKEVDAFEENVDALHADGKVEVYVAVVAGFHLVLMVKLV